MKNITLVRKFRVPILSKSVQNASPEESKIQAFFQRAFGIPFSSHVRLLDREKERKSVFFVGNSVQTLILKVFVFVLSFVTNFWTVFSFGSIPCVVCIFWPMCSVVWFLYTILCIWTLLGYFCWQRYSFNGFWNFFTFPYQTCMKIFEKLYETCVLKRNSHRSSFDILGDHFRF